MKLHHKLNMTKDENNEYEDYSVEYQNYKLTGHIDYLEKLVNIYRNYQKDYTSQQAMAFWYAICESMPLEKALNGLEYGLDCETPIETLYYFAFCYIMQKLKINLFLIPQFEIEVENKNYRVDFIVVNHKEEKPTYIVECDGFEYHSSSKQQARDNQRQRDLENAGYTIIRFSGSEIYNDPIKCVYETLRRLDIEE